MKPLKEQGIPDFPLIFALVPWQFLQRQHKLSRKRVILLVPLRVLPRILDLSSVLGSSRAVLASSEDVLPPGNEVIYLYFKPNL